MAAKASLKHFASSTKVLSKSEIQDLRLFADAGSSTVENRQLQQTSRCRHCLLDLQTGAPSGKDLADQVSTKDHLAGSQPNLASSLQACSQGPPRPGQEATTQPSLSLFPLHSCLLLQSCLLFGWESFEVTTMYTHDVLHLEFTSTSPGLTSLERRGASEKNTRLFVIRAGFPFAALPCCIQIPAAFAEGSTQSKDQQRDPN